MVGQTRGIGRTSGIKLLPVVALMWGVTSSVQPIPGAAGGDRLCFDLFLPIRCSVPLTSSGSLLVVIDTLTFRDQHCLLVNLEGVDHGQLAFILNGLNRLRLGNIGRCETAERQPNYSTYTSRWQQ